MSIGVLVATSIAQHLVNYTVISESMLFHSNLINIDIDLLKALDTSTSMTWNDLIGEFNHLSSR
jgi:hypothetical protein